MSSWELKIQSTEPSRLSAYSLLSTEPTYMVPSAPMAGAALMPAVASKAHAKAPSGSTAYSFLSRELT